MIFSKSLTESKVRLEWKRANFVPVFKKGDKSLAGNYRPVSLTSLACKIIESIHDKIVEFLSVNSLIKDTQHGFWKGRSCLTNLLEFLDIATNSFEGGNSLMYHTLTLVRLLIRYHTQDWSRSSTHML